VSRPLEDVRAYIIGRVTEGLEAKRLAPVDVTDDFDLLTEGVIDSFGFVELMLELEERCGVSIDFDGIDAEDLTRVGPLSRYVEAAGASGGGSAD
jgi:acyl carrier protein